MPHTCKYPTRQQSSSRLPPWLMCMADWLISDKRRPSQWATRKRQLCRYLKTVASNTTWLRPIFYLFYKSKHGKWTIKVSNHPGLPLLFFLQELILIPGTCSNEWADMYPGQRPRHTVSVQCSSVSPFLSCHLWSSPFSFPLSWYHETKFSLYVQCENIYKGGLLRTISYPHCKEEWGVGLDQHIRSDECLELKSESEYLCFRKGCFPSKPNCWSTLETQ